MTVFDVLHPKSSYIPSVRRFCGRKGIGSVKNTAPTIAKGFSLKYLCGESGLKKSDYMMLSVCAHLQMPCQIRAQEE